MAGGERDRGSCRDKKSHASGKSEDAISCLLTSVNSKNGKNQADSSQNLLSANDIDRQRPASAARHSGTDKNKDGGVDKQPGHAGDFSSVRDSFSASCPPTNEAGDSSVGRSDLLERILDKLDNLASGSRVKPSKRPRSATSSSEDDDYSPRTRRRRRRADDYFDSESSPSSEEGQIHDSAADGADPFAGLENFSNSKSNTGNQASKLINFDSALADLQQGYQSSEPTGPPIKTIFADIINSGLRRRPNENVLENTVGKYPFPENCKNMSVPRVNQAVWDKVNPVIRQADNTAQKNQKLLLKGLMPIVKLIDDLGNDVVPPCGVILSSLTDSCRMLSSLFVNTCQARKELIKTDLMEPYTKLCVWDQPISQEFLFGDDIAKSIKDIADSEVISKKIRSKSSKKNSASRFSGNKPYRSFRNSGSRDYDSRPFLGHRPGGRRFDRFPRNQYQTHHKKTGNRKTDKK